MEPEIKVGDRVRVERGRFDGATGTVESIGGHEATVCRRETEKPQYIVVKTADLRRLGSYGNTQVDTSDPSISAVEGLRRELADLPPTLPAKTRAILDDLAK